MIDPADARRALELAYEKMLAQIPDEPFEPRYGELRQAVGLTRGDGVIVDITVKAAVL